MNYTFTENPYKEDKPIILPRGFMNDAKIAKLNNLTKRPAILKHWEENRPNEIVSLSNFVTTKKDYSSLLNNIGLEAVNYAPKANNLGAKKLRVNKVVNEKSINVYNNSDKVDVIPLPKVVETPKPEVKEEIKVESPLEPNIVSNREEIRGRHERTGEIPVEAIKETVKEEKIPMTSRVERNAFVSESKQEAKAGDMDLYNNLLHNAPIDEDVSKQLQGARNQLSIEKEESRKLAEQYGDAVKELERLKEDIAQQKKAKEQQVKQELNDTLKNIEALQKENLERTSDLTSIQSEIAKLKAEKRAMEESFYEDNRSYGRAA